jgi:uncharacterized protein (TIGR03083 family)
VEIAEHIDALRDQGALLAEAAGRAGLDAAVPRCPPWLVKDLLRHTGYIHRWAARHIIECPARVLEGPPEAEILRGGAPDPDLIAWFLAGHRALVETLAAADPALECGTFMDAPSALAFWARRQAHETAIHRADAESALGLAPEYPPGFAADGIDELIMGFGPRRKYRPPAGDAGGVRVRTTDTGDAWHVSASAGRIQCQREPQGPPGPDDGTVSGPASAVYLFLWNRVDPGPAGATISGNQDFLTAWQSSVRVRWD